MATTDYLRVTLLGSFPSSEVWSTSVAVAFVGPAPYVFTQTMCESAATRIVTALDATVMSASLRALMSTSAAITGIRVEARWHDNSILFTGQANYPAPLAGTGGASKTLQDALTLSLRTEVAGAKGRGRMYWPALGASLNIGFKLSSPANTAVVTGTKALLLLIRDQINAELLANGVVTFTAAIGVRSVKDGLTRHVTRIQVGDVIDTQRRRRDKLPESYSAVNFP